ncbi:MAG: hypothetical protein LBU90_10660 [Bacteroidales bacterium]|jgi:hypothetical protein|nr:hypothetical protein [Bacteroidales bacterium]
MYTIIEILKLTIPGVIVFFTAFYLIKMFLKNESEKRKDDLRAQNQKITTPIKVQAYERLVLFLERINPESLLLRTQTPHMQAGQLHSDLLATIRAEFEHNLSQQIYVSPACWLAVKRAKETLITIINEEAAGIAATAPAHTLSAAILSRMITQKNPIPIAIDALKIEAQGFI